jgi:hypothetical protein
MLNSGKKDIRSQWNLHSRPRLYHKPLKLMIESGADANMACLLPKVRWCLPVPSSLVDPNVPISIEPPTVPGAPSGPRGDRQVIPQLVIKDASHPDFASQSKPPPSGPSKRVLALPDAGDSPKGLPTGPRAKTGVPPSPDTERSLKPSPLPLPNPLQVRSPPSHLISNGNAMARRNKIEHDRDEAINLREQVCPIALFSLSVCNSPF